MQNAISTFFSSWQTADKEERSKLIDDCVIEEITYLDPRTQATINGKQALSEYVGMFSANAPGWKAEVIKSDNIGSFTRVTIDFNGQGPDGEMKSQLGQYFVEMKEDLIVSMVGFVGIGD